MREDAVLETDHEHDVVLEALRVVEGHQRHDPLVVLQVVLLGEEGDLLEELLDGGLVRVPVVLARHAHELLQVLEPPLGLDRALGLERRQVTGVLERLLKQVAHRGLVGAVAQALHRVHEATHRLDRRRPQPWYVLGGHRDVEDRLAHRVRVRGEPAL